LFDARGVGTVTSMMSPRGKLSRGSFYNYFATFEAMLFELGGDITTRSTGNRTSSATSRMWASAFSSSCAISCFAPCPIALVAKFFSASCR